MQLIVNSGQLPVGWVVKKLAEVCQIEKSQGIYTDLPYIGMENIESNTARFIGSTEPQSVKSSTFKFSPNHILYGRLRPYLNKVLAPDFVGHCSTEIFPIKPSECLNRNFLLYWLLMDSTVKRIDATCTGARMPRANMNSVFEFDFSLPPLPEQKQIVAILDEAFEGIDRAIANTEKNLANARELFESYLNAIFTQKNKRGEIFQLAEICEKKRVITYGVIKLGEHIDDGVLCLRTSNVRWLDIDVNGIKRISPSLSADYKRTILKGGEVLVNVRGTLGGVAVTTPEMAGWNISREVALVPIDIKRVHPAYLAYWIGAKTNQQWLSGVQKGAAYTGINLEDLRTLPVVVPDLKEQERLINSIEEVHSVSQRLEAIYRQKIAALKELKQSILQKAFTGELTADTANQTTKAAKEGIAA